MGTQAKTDSPQNERRQRVQTPQMAKPNHNTPLATAIQHPTVNTTTECTTEYRIATRVIADVETDC